MAKESRETPPGRKAGILSKSARKRRPRRKLKTSRRISATDQTGAALPHRDDTVYMPITNPAAEKAAIERGEKDYLDFLAGQSRRSLYITPDQLGERISEVYRLYFEMTKSLGVISDFAAHNPRLAFGARWLAEMLEWHSIWKYNAPNGHNELLLTLADGFRGASRWWARARGSLRAARLEVAQYPRKELQKKLKDFFMESDLAAHKRAGSIERIEPQIQRFADEIVNENPAILKPKRKKIVNLIRKGRAHRASALITSWVFGVRARNLERAPS